MSVEIVEVHHGYARACLAPKHRHTREGEEEMLDGLRQRTDPQAKATMAVKEVQLFKEQRWIYAMKCTYELPRSFFLRKNDKRFATSFIRRITRKIRPSLFFFHRNQAKKTTRSTRVQPLSA